jgi:hypothetical protein
VNDAVTVFGALARFAPGDIQNIKQLAVLSLSTQHTGSALLRFGVTNLTLKPTRKPLKSISQSQKLITST